MKVPLGGTPRRLKTTSRKPPPHNLTSTTPENCDRRMIWHTWFRGTAPVNLKLHSLPNQSIHTHMFRISRWWFASSAFPMIAATLGPVASAFSICALGSKWRLHITPGKSIDQATFIDDPAWYVDVVLATELSLARSTCITQLTICATGSQSSTPSNWQWLSSPTLFFC